MPKVLRIINRFNLGGPTYNAAYLTRYLPDNYETLLVGGMKDESEDSSQFIVENLGISPMIMPEMRRKINLNRDILAYRQLKKIIREFQPDIVHTHASKPGALGRLAAAEMKVPVIVHTFHGHVFHSYFNPIVTDIYKTIERSLAKKSNSIIAISEKQKEEISLVHNICPPEKVAVIPLGFDLNRFQENLEEKRSIFREEFLLAEDDVAVSIVGRLVPVKNHGMFIRAVKWVQDNTNTRIRAFIVGDGEERANLEQICEEAGIDYSHRSEAKATVTFTSWVKNVDYVNAGSDIVALTSKNEGTPVSLIEAQAASKPIVSTRVGGIENVVIPNQTALLSEPNDEEGFRTNLLMLAENRELRNRFGEKGWEFVKEKFHYQRLVKDVVNLYEQLMP